MKSAIEAAHARIQPYIRETPVEPWAAAGPNVYLKLEHLQRTGSFKLRGASNKIALLTPDQAARGVVAASNGNHGLGVAAAAQARGIEAEVYVSTHVSPAKARPHRSPRRAHTQSRATIRLLPNWRRGARRKNRAACSSRPTTISTW